MAHALGFDYLTASTKDEFKNCIDIFVAPQISGKPIIFEAFTEKVDDADVLRLIRQINGENKESIIKKTCTTIKNVVKTCLN